MPLPRKLNDADLALLALRSRDTLRARYKMVAREHCDRIKRLDALMQQISAKPPTAEATGELLATSASLTPELESLLMNPTAGL